MAVLPLRIVTSTPASASAFAPAPAPAPSLGFELVRGTLIELSGEEGSARTTTAVHLARDAQRCGEPVLWIELDDEGVYGPDLASSGIDLDAFVLVRLDAREGLAASFRAAEIGLRSGGFGLVFIDLGTKLPKGSGAAWQGRLLGLVREHRASVVLSSARAADSESLGPLVSLRLVPHRTRQRETHPQSQAPSSLEGMPFTVTHTVAKSKRGDVHAIGSFSYDAPLGL